MANLWSEQNLFKARFSSCSSVDCCWLRTLHVTAGCQLKLRLQVLTLAAGCRLKGGCGGKLNLWLSAAGSNASCRLKLWLQAHALWLLVSDSGSGCRLQAHALAAGCRFQLWMLAAGASLAAGPNYGCWLGS